MALAPWEHEEQDPAGLLQRLLGSGQRSLAAVQHRLELAMRGLHSVSPLATLERGYAIVQDAASGKVIVRANDIAVGADVRARLAHGELLATVKSTRDG